MITITIVGADELARALANAQADIQAAIDQAHDDALAALGPAIDRVTPVDTGLLRSQNELLAGPDFRVTYSNFTPYASFVDARRDFVARGVERGERGAVRAYDEAIDRFAEDFGDAE